MENAGPKYHNAAFDAENLPENNIDRLQLGMIPAGSRVLEIGCATGFMAAFLRDKKGCQVTGLEYDPGHAAIAARNCTTLIVGDIAARELQEKIDALTAQDGGFDVIFMSQCIEHLATPEPVLDRIRGWLAPKGFLVISSCNVAHWRGRLMLLAGRFRYEDYGIFDRSHLRFFTVHSFRRMLEERGYTVTDEGYSFEDICPFKILFGTRILAPSDLLRLLPFVGSWLRRRYIHRFRNLIASQFVYKAVVANKAADAAPGSGNPSLS